ncbi:MAG: TRAP transporter TatT component family protein [Acidobacteriota bacterium]|nr:TRAP transporter TatT component family protein [Acidobacteriota bacterium]MDH3528530.1 TRAP transporter TatT component family protein [Acidobacteriota bacterium]
MKHKKTYELVRKLIDERELDDENLDEANGELLELVDQDPVCGWAYGLLSEIYYWTGEYADAEDKLFYYGEGVKYGEQGVEVDEDSLEANFWLSVNWGSFGQEKGIMKSLALINPIKAAAEKVIEMDEGYFYGGPWRVLGRLYDKAPGFPFSIGDGRKAEECLERALELGPRFYLNHLFLAEHYIAAREKSKAKEHLEWILGAPLNKNHEREDEGYKEDAELLLEGL